jgi:hypothetical protein
MQSAHPPMKVAMKMGIQMMYSWIIPLDLNGMSVVSASEPAGNWHREGVHTKGSSFWVEHRQRRHRPSFLESRA